MDLQEADAPAFVYDGSVGGLYRLFWRNLLLTVLTLGIYRFWAIARIRRYAWSHMRFQGEPFAYTGTGGEMFKGALVAGVILFALNLLLQGVLLVFPFQVVASLLQSGLLTMLGFAAVFAAQRYRLSRTHWRGVRGGGRQGALDYGLFGLGVSILIGVTLGIAWPVATTALARRRIGAASFGSLHFACTATSGPIYGTFGAMVVVLLAAGVPGTALTVWLVRSHPAPEAAWVLGSMLALAGAAVLVGISAYLAASARRCVEGATTLGPLRFSNTVTGGDLLRLWLGNLLILLVTAGLGYPYVLHRRLRLTARTVRVRGVLDGAALQQSDEPAPARGEGLLSQLDPSGAF